MEFPQTEDTLVSCDAGGEVVMWRVSTLRAMESRRPHGNAHMLAVHHATDGRVVTQDRVGRIRMWRWETTDQGTSEYDVQGMPHSFCQFALASPTAAYSSGSSSLSGLMIATHHSDDHIALWDARTSPARPASVFKFDHSSQGMCMSLHVSAFTPGAAAANAASHIVGGFENGGTLAWDTRYPKQPATWSTQHHQDAVTSMCFSQANPHSHGHASSEPPQHDQPEKRGGAGNRALKLIGFTAGADKCVQSLVFDVQGGISSPPKLKGGLKLPTTIGHMALRPDARILAAGCWDNTVRLFAAKNLKPLGVLMFHRESCHTVAFSPHSGILASSGADAKIALWDCFTDSFTRSGR